MSATSKHLDLMAGSLGLNPPQFQTIDGGITAGRRQSEMIANFGIFQNELDSTKSTQKFSATGSVPVATP